MANVVCSTEGCGNQGHGIAVPTTYVDDEGNTTPVDAVVCGACGELITDITEDERVGT
jgi:hypothetical protein